MMFWLYVGILGLSALVYVMPLLYSSASRVRAGFAFLAAAIAYWSLCTYHVWTGYATLFWVRGSFVSAVAGVYSLSLLVLFLRRNFRFHLPTISLLSLWSLFISGFSISDALVVSVQGPMDIHYGWAHPVFGLYILSMFVFIFTILFFDAKRSRGFDRFKRQVFLVGLATYIVSASISNLYLPLVGVQDFGQLGPLFLVTFVAISMVPLLVLRPFFYLEVIRKFILIIGMTLSVALLYVGFQFIAKIYGGSYYHNNWLFNALASGGVLLLFPYIQDFLNAVTTRLVFRTHYHYQESLRDLTQLLSRLIHVDEIVNTLTFSLPVLLKVDQVQVFIKDRNGYFQAMGVKRHWSKNALNSFSTLLRELKNHQSVIVRENILFQSRFISNTKQKDRYIAISSEMDDLGVEVALPLRIAGEMGGFILFGARRGVATYSEDNVALMQVVANHVSASLQNAVYFERLQQSRRQMEELNRYLISVSANLEYDVIMELTSNALSHLFDVEWTVAFSGDGGPVLRPTYSSFGRLSDLEGMRVSADNFADNRFNSGLKERPFFIHPSDRPGQLGYELLPLFNYHGMSSVVVLPVIYQGQLRGALLGFFKTPRLGYSTSRSEFIDYFSQVSNAAISNALLFDDLQEAKDFNAEVLRNLTTGVILVDNHLMITAINLQAERYLGVSQSRYLGQSLSSLYELCADLVVLERSFTEEVVVSVQTQIKYSKLDKTLAITSDVIRSNEHVIGGMLIMSDITPLRELQTQLSHSDRLGSLGTLAEGVAHEIKNPLVAIKTFAQLLPSKWEDESFRNKYVEVVAPQVDRINDICISLLRLGRAKTPKVETIRLHEVFDEISTLTLPEQKASKVDVEVVGDLALSFEADREQLFHLLLNVVRRLIQNASHVSGGQVVLRVMQDNAHHLILDATSNGAYLTEEQEQRFFDPFFQAYDGASGMGMSIAYRIIDELEGSIELTRGNVQGFGLMIRLPGVVSSPVDG
ncbi:MAG: ATP-binding protein [bacterium]|nr:ATP-binding protein [bacterium]